MTLNLGVVMDPIESITVKKDTTLAMLLAAQRKGWAIHYMQQRDLYSAQGISRANMTPLEVRDDPQSWFTLGESGDKALSDLDVILMRKDPPFNLDYIYSTFLLEQAHR